MNIALVSTSPPFRGGIAEHTKGLYQELSKTNKVRIFSFSYQYPSFFFPGKKQTTDISIDVKHTDFTINSINPLSWIRTVRKICAFMPDIVIFNYWNPFFAPCFGFIARKLKHRIGKEKIISICHNIIPHEKSFIDKTLIKYYLKPFNKFIFMSSFVENELKFFKTDFKSVVRFLPINEKTNQIIQDSNYKSTFRKELNIDASEKIILFFGLIRPYKGLDTLLFSLEKTFKDVHNSKLIIAGEAYENKDKYLSIIKRLKIEDRVIWIDRFISQDEVERIMLLSDLLVLPYKFSSQSGVLSQAWQYSLPTIVSNAGGLPEYVDDEESGYIIESGNFEDLGKKISNFFKSNDNVRMPEYMKHNKSKFYWKNYISGIFELTDES